MSGQARSDARVPQVWLPSLQVWAASGGIQHAPGGSASSGADGTQHAGGPAMSRPLKRKAEDTARDSELFELAAARDEQQQQPQGYTGFELQEQPSDRELSDDDEVLEVEPLPHCSICKPALWCCRYIPCSSASMTSPSAHLLN